ncbi:MAG TPA: DUF411 domain-containing protein [Longimicrobiales bacterium]|nr:DUF411 domain-containing protein [Longimicrobiales bacterium]
MKRLICAAAGAVILAACGTADAADGTPSDDALALAEGQELPTVVVFKTATCLCCGGWVEHMRHAGFAVDARDLPSNLELMQVKAEAGVPASMTTCHTAVVDGYVVEGHVPADQVKRLLEERPDVAGIVAPGMPMGSPGMEGPNARPYQVMAFDHQGATTLFAEIDPR